ncbi:IclR family transcriptional regulator [Streptomyces monticola]|uniref:IclR family transcriptional regulator n=1 Tax=Streptomyces monticola TaxID=2666263 RepID=A0ABW2JL82_9ACTN
MTAPATGPAGPRSVDRALEILDAVADAPRPVPAKTLARELGCALSTVYHLLGPLTARGHLIRTPEGYAPGPRVPALHQAFRSHLQIGPGIGELLLRVRREAGAEAYFTTYHDGRITVIDTTAPAAGPEPWTPGIERRAHATAHGKALLAALPRTARRRYLDDHGMPRLTERTITTGDRFEAELARVRAQGLAVSVGEADPAYTCLAVTLPDRPRAGVVQAVSVAVPTRTFRRRQGELRSVVRRAAAGRL